MNARFLRKGEDVVTAGSTRAGLASHAQPCPLTQNVAPVAKSFSGKLSRTAFQACTAFVVSRLAHRHREGVPHALAGWRAEDKQPERSAPG